MQLPKLYILPLASLVVLIGTLILGVPVAQSLNSVQRNPTQDGAEASQQVRRVVASEHVLLIQTRGGRVEMIPEARAVILTGVGVAAIEDENGEVIRASENLGGEADVIATATMPETEALHFLETGEVIVPLDSK